MWIPLYHIDAPLSLSEFMQEKVREAHNIENFFQCLSEMLKFPTGMAVWVLRETRITLTMHTFSPVSHFCLFFTFFPPGFSLFSSILSLKASLDHSPVLCVGDSVRFFPTTAAIRSSRDSISLKRIEQWWRHTFSRLEFFLNVFYYYFFCFYSCCYLLGVNNFYKNKCEEKKIQLRIEEKKWENFCDKPKKQWKKYLQKTVISETKIKHL